MNQKKNTNNKERLEKTSTEGVRPNINTIIHGNWYDDDYITDLKQTKSPQMSKDILGRFIQLEIDTSKVINNQLEVAAIGVYEGDWFDLILKPGTLNHSLQTNISNIDGDSYELVYHIEGNDTTLTLVHLNKRDKPIDKKVFHKSLDTTSDEFQHQVNQVLFAGNYLAIDNLGNEYQLHLTENGELNGLPDFQSYYILTDFTVGINDNLDEICFDIQTANQVCYAFQITLDTIYLYETEVIDDFLQKKGNAKYKWIKVDG